MVVAEAVRTVESFKTSLFSMFLESRRAPGFVDITDRVIDMVYDSNVRNGSVVVFSRHTTAAITIQENEPLLLADLVTLLERIAPPSADYHHDDFTIRTVNMHEDERQNGHSHCQQLFLGASEAIPVVEGNVALGQWQRIFMVELDQPKPREVLVQVMGI